MNQKLLFALSLILILSSHITAGSFEDGYKAFVYNKPLEASTQFEKAINEDPGNGAAYIYLAISYEQLGKFDKAHTIFLQAYEKGFGQSWKILGNMGLVMSLNGDFKSAIGYFDRAVGENPDYIGVYFNRANAYAQLKNYQAAKADYVKFLEVGATHEKAPEARKMLAAIDEESARAEAARLAEEKRKKELEDLARTAAERAAQEAERKRIEEEKRKKLLDDVFNSLDNAQDDTVIIGPGAEDVGQNEDQYGREN